MSLKSVCGHEVECVVDINKETDTTGVHILIY